VLANNYTVLPKWARPYMVLKRLGEGGVWRERERELKYKGRKEKGGSVGELAGFCRRRFLMARMLGATTF